MKNITYIFSGPRKDRYLKNDVEAKEFYYGLFSFLKTKNNINIIEFNKSKNLLGKFLGLVDKVMARIFSLPFYMSHVVNINNYKIIKKTDHIFLINENVGCSVLPMLIFLSRNKKPKISMFVMGLYSKKQRVPIFRKIHYLIIKVLVSNVDHVLFLGKGELNKAKSIHPKLQEKFIYFPFSVDTEFWRSKDKLDLEKNNKIIFVGNDGNRNASLLIKIAEKLPKIDFIFVTKIKELQKINLPNVTVLSGSWGDQNITDTKLKSLYLESRLTIIPLKETSQPSGQSVALQSMSLGVPVIISTTEGFWDNEAFNDNIHIFLERENIQDSWVKKIDTVFTDIDLLEKVAKNAQENIDANFNLSNFNLRINKLM